jgi:hypothetical protein
MGRKLSGDFVAQKRVPLLIYSPRKAVTPSISCLLSDDHLNAEIRGKIGVYAYLNFSATPWDLDFFFALLGARIILSADALRKPFNFPTVAVLGARHWEKPPSRGRCCQTGGNAPLTPLN